MQTEVMIFVHHFLTHSTVWEIRETDYASLADARRWGFDPFFKGADRKVYMGSQPMMMRRVKADEYCNVQDNEYQRHTIIDLT